MAARPLRLPAVTAHPVPSPGTPVPAPVFVVIERGRHADGRQSRGRWVIVVETVRPLPQEAVSAWLALRSPAQQASVFWRVIPAHVGAGATTKYHRRHQPPGARDVG